MRCWFCRGSYYHGHPTAREPDGRPICDECRDLLADFRHWLHHRHERVSA